MPQSYKGIPQLYDEVFALLAEDGFSCQHFYEWITGFNGTLQEGQVCYTVISFFKRKRWFLQEHNYIPDNEENSTWFARELIHRLPEEVDSGYVKKYFDLEKGESLITNNCKVRPVILLKHNMNDWWNPSVETGKVESWTCLPIFSYKDRHIQRYVVNDQKLNTNRFYIPVASSDQPGINLESAAIYESVQTIQVGNLKPCRCFCNQKGMNIPFKLSEFALKLIVYHQLVQSNNLKCFTEMKTQYDLFKGITADYFASYGF